MPIYVFGDDHARQAFGLCANVRLHWLGPYTMRRVSRDGAFKPLEIGMPTSGDTMIYMVGAEDVRRHLFRSALKEDGDLAAAVTSLAQRYVTAVHGLTTLLNFPMTICVVRIVAPAAPN